MSYIDSFHKIILSFNCFLPKNFQTVQNFFLLLILQEFLKLRPFHATPQNFYFSFYPLLIKMFFRTQICPLPSPSPNISDQTLFFVRRRCLLTYQMATRSLYFSLPVSPANMSEATDLLPANPVRRLLSHKANSSSAQTTFTLHNLN